MFCVFPFSLTVCMGVYAFVCVLMNLKSCLHVTVGLSLVSVFCLFAVCEHRNLKYEISHNSLIGT